MLGRAGSRQHRGGASGGLDPGGGSSVVLFPGGSVPAPTSPSPTRHLGPTWRGNFVVVVLGVGGLCRKRAHDTVVRLLPFGVPSLSPYFLLVRPLWQLSEWTGQKIEGADELKGHRGPRLCIPTPPSGSRGPWGGGTGKTPGATWVPGAWGAWGALPRWAPRQVGLGGEAGG